jgi:hypothetical protein
MVSISRERWLNGNKMNTLETMKFNVGNVVLVIKDIQFKINGDICHVFEGDAGIVTSVGDFITVSIYGVKYDFLTSDLIHI